MKLDPFGQNNLIDNDFEKAFKKHFNSSQIDPQLHESFMTTYRLTNYNYDERKWTIEGQTFAVTSLVYTNMRHCFLRMNDQSISEEERQKARDQLEIYVKNSDDKTATKAKEGNKTTKDSEGQKNRLFNQSVKKIKEMFTEKSEFLPEGLIGSIKEAVRNILLHVSHRSYKECKSINSHFLKQVKCAEKMIGPQAYSKFLLEYPKDVTCQDKMLSENINVHNAFNLFEQLEDFVEQEKNNKIQKLEIMLNNNNLDANEKRNVKFEVNCINRYDTMNVIRDFYENKKHSWNNISQKSVEEINKMFKDFFVNQIAMAVKIALFYEHDKSYSSLHANLLVLVDDNLSYRMHCTLNARKEIKDIVSIEKYWIQKDNDHTIKQTPTKEIVLQKLTDAAVKEIADVFFLMREAVDERFHFICEQIPSVTNVAQENWDILTFLKEFVEAFLQKNTCFPMTNRDMVVYHVFKHPIDPTGAEDKKNVIKLPLTPENAKKHVIDYFEAATKFLRDDPDITWCILSYGAIKLSFRGARTTKRKMEIMCGYHNGKFRVVMTTFN